MSEPRRVDVRPAAAGDAEAVASLLTELGHPTGPAAARERLAALAARGPTYTVLVAESGGAVQGLMSAFVTPVLHRAENVGRLSVVVVAESARGTGIGKRLVEEAEAFCRAHGCARMELTTADHRHGAHAFYARLGFEQQGLRFTRIL